MTVFSDGAYTPVVEKRALPADAAFLRRSEILSALHADDLAYIAERGASIDLDAGDILFNPGDAADRFFIVAAGSVRVLKPRRDGLGLDEVAVFEPGDPLGEFDFARGAVYDARAEAREPSRAYVFPAPGRTFAELERERPDVAARIRLKSLVMLSSRLRSVQLLISENSPWVRELQRRAYEDRGTGLWTKAYLDEVAWATISARTVLIALKPDGFKALVDARGHAAGDDAMAAIADVLRDVARRHGNGLAVRLRSNETLLVLPDCGDGAAEGAAAALEAGFSALAPVDLGGDRPPFSFRTSGTVLAWPDDGNDFHALLETARSRLNEVWASGGGRIEFPGRRGRAP